MNGKVLRYMRQNLFISQEKLADLTGVSYQTITRAENNRQKPNYVTLSKLQHFLGFTDVDIYEITDLLNAKPSKETAKRHAAIKTKLRRQAKL
jgi:transcriptional regulator with XRE-family HTH domain